MANGGTSGNQHRYGSQRKARLGDCDGVLFDLDGVLTPTAELHEAAWKRTFDDFLHHYSRGAAVPFDHSDYRRYVDGKPRLDGVRSFLSSRGITLPEGSATDPPDRLTVRGLGARKGRLFEEYLERGALAAFPGATALLRWLHARHIRTAVVSASHNCRRVLAVTGLAGFFDTVVDGYRADRDGLQGKPAPDVFLAGAVDLGLPPARCAVVEDAIAGVEAGQAGGFGLVVGVDRSEDGDVLLAHGADIVIRDLAELILDGQEDV